MHLISRMPVILSRSDEHKWLEDIPLNQVISLLKAYDPNSMKAYPISTAVNSPSNNSADILNPAS